jgi:hypothetical protein
MSAATEPRVEQLRDEVDEQRAELRVAVQQFEHAARRAFELDHRFGTHPWMWTAGAFVLGLWIGGKSR